MLNIWWSFSDCLVAHTRWLWAGNRLQLNLVCSRATLKSPGLYAQWLALVWDRALPRVKSEDDTPKKQTKKALEPYKTKSSSVEPTHAQQLLHCSLPVNPRVNLSHRCFNRNQAQLQTEGDTQPMKGTYLGEPSSSGQGRLCHWTPQHTYYIGPLY